MESKQNWFQSQTDKKLHEKFLRDVLEVLLQKAVFQGTSRDNPVVQWTEPEVLERVFPDLEDLPKDHDQLLEIIENVVKYSVKTGHPRFVNQLFSSLDPYGLSAQWITDALNPSVYTYEVAPVFTILEQKVLQEMRNIVGFPDGDGDGLFCPGGSMANIYALHCARHRFLPDTKTKGLFGLGRLVLFASEDAHYSVKKAAMLLGIGSENVIGIPIDSRGKMDSNKLRERILEAKNDGALPFLVFATAGTTVLGAFDPLQEISAICSQFKLWFHVDAAWGGGALMSPKYRHLLKGIEKADSVTWNPHKLLAVPQQCSAYLVRDTRILLEANSQRACYLFQQDKFYDAKWDTGDKHIQCGRRADVLKYWLMWQAKGTLGLQKHVEKIFATAEYFTEKIRHREGFKLLVDDPEFLNVCFWYLPKSMRNGSFSSVTNDELHKVAPRIKERMVKEGSLMMTYQSLRQWPNFFRFVLQNSAVSFDDVDFIIEEIDRLGCDL